MSQTEVSAAASTGRQVFRLVRPDDQVDLQVELVDLTPQATPGGGAHQLDPVAGGYLLLTLPPQHVGESARTSPEEIAHGQRPVFGRDTVLVFEAPAGGAPIPFTVEGILGALPRLRLVTDSVAGAAPPLPAPPPRATAAAVVSASARLRAGDGPAAERAAGAGDADALAERARRSAARLPVAVPEPLAAPEEAASVAAAAAGAFRRLTELRLPSRLVLTPRGGANRFVHAAAPVVHDGRVELWHTRLARLRLGDGRAVEVPADLIALESEEIDPGTSDWHKRVGDGRLTPGLHQLNRARLVEQSKSRPWITEQLMLSGLGAWLDADRSWNSSSDKLKGYRHRMAMGRDVVVRTVDVGRLFPLNHEAILTTTTTRVFPKANGAVAALQTTQVVTVLEPTRTYGDNEPAERGLPWGSVTILTRSTPADPDIKTVNFVASGGVMTRVLRHGTTNEPVAYRCLGVDRGGRTTAFELPLVFMPDGIEDRGPLAAAYNGPQGADLRTIELGGQVLSVAPPSADAPEATDVVAQRVALTTHIEPRTGSGGPRVTLTTSQIVGAVPTLQRFAPSAAGPQVLRFAQPYLDHGFHPERNAGEVLLQLAAGAAPTVDLGDPQVTGGLVAPQFPLQAVSRLAGPVGGPIVGLATGKVKAADVIGNLVGDVTLFGVFPLSELIGDLDLDLRTGVPKLVTHALDGVSAPHLHWKVPLFKAGPQEVRARQEIDVDAGPVSGAIRPLGDREANLVIDATTELVQPVDPANPVVRSRATCRIENVSLSLGLLDQQLVVVPVEHISFTSTDGSKPDLDAKLGDLQFHGVLAFLRTLADLVPGGTGFSDPPALDVTDDGVRSSFAVLLPPVASGMFVLENITFSAGLDLWFAKPPELNLAFSTPENRFRLTVLCLGGGGYLGVGLSTRGLERLDGMLEFGAAVSVNLGVARGAVSVMGGIHFAYDRDTGAALSGYLEVRGEVDVLGILEVSVKLLVVLTYVFETEELIGRAEMEVSVKVLFWRKTVRISFDYTFAGGGGGDRAAQRALATPGGGMPGFLDQMAPANWPRADARPWDTYCLSYA